MARLESSSLLLKIIPNTTFSVAWRITLRRLNSINLKICGNPTNHNSVIASPHKVRNKSLGEVSEHSPIA